MYAITKLIHDYLESRHMKLTELAVQLGYRNISRGFRKLTNFTEKGVTNAYIREKLVSVAGMDAEAIDKALRETRGETEREKAEAERRREQEERERFLPALRAVTQRPGLNRCFLFRKDPTRLSLPEGLSEKPYDEQLEIARDCIRKFNRRLRGKRPGFGRLYGFKFSYEYGKSVELSPDGQVTELNHKKPTGIRVCLIAAGDVPEKRNRNQKIKGRKEKNSKSEQN